MDSDAIPVDVAKYFPNQLKGAPAGGGRAPQAVGGVSAPAAPIAVIVPTHDHAATLPFSIGSITAQTVADLDIVIIGDGVGDDTRDAVADLRRDDPPSVSSIVPSPAARVSPPATRCSPPWSPRWSRITAMTT